MRDKDKITTIIYCFLCLKTGTPVYVGKTTMPLKTRITNHLGTAKRKASTPFHQWLRDNINNYKVIILETVSFFESSKSEIRWMLRLSKRFPLYNVRAFSFGNPGIGRVEWNSDTIDMLGKKTDTEIAEALGCNRQTVAYRRSLLNISRFPDPHKVASEKVLDLVTLMRLGTEPDYKIADELGISKFVIAKHRKRRGIKSYAESTGNNGRVKLGNSLRRPKP